MKSILMLAMFLSFGFASRPTQLFNTSLTVTVRDELGNIVEGASVKLFVKEEDYTKEQNWAEEAATDKKGVVRFKKLKPITYIILSRKDDKDNTDGGPKTVKLEDGKFNKVNSIIF